MPRDEWCAHNFHRTEEQCPYCEIERLIAQMRKAGRQVVLINTDGKRLYTWLPPFGQLPEVLLVENHIYVFHGYPSLPEYRRIKTIFQVAPQYVAEHQEPEAVPMTERSALEKWQDKQLYEALLAPLEALPPTPKPDAPLAPLADAATEADHPAASAEPIYQRREIKTKRAELQFPNMNAGAADAEIIATARATADTAVECEPCGKPVCESLPAQQTT